MLKNHQELGKIASEIEKIEKLSVETRAQVDRLTEKISSLKSSTRDRMNEAREKRSRVSAMTQKLETNEEKWDSEKSR